MIILPPPRPLFPRSKYSSINNSGVQIIGSVEISCISNFHLIKSYWLGDRKFWKICDWIGDYSLIRTPLVMFPSSYRIGKNRFYRQFWRDRIRNRIGDFLLIGMLLVSGSAKSHQSDHKFDSYQSDTMMGTSLVLSGYAKSHRSDH